MRMVHVFHSAVPPAGAEAEQIIRLQNSDLYIDKDRFDALVASEDQVQFVADPDDLVAVAVVSALTHNFAQEREAIAREKGATA